MILKTREDTYMTASFAHGPLDGDLLLRLLPMSKGWVVEAGGKGFPQIVHPEQESPEFPGKAEVLRYHAPNGFAHYYMWSYEKQAYLHLHAEDLDGYLAPFGNAATAVPMTEIGVEEAPKAWAFKLPWGKQ